jgi:hypothetical protein
LQDKKQKLRYFIRIDPALQPKTWGYETQTLLVSISSKQIISIETLNLKKHEKLPIFNTGNTVHYL